MNAPVAEFTQVHVKISTGEMFLQGMDYDRMRAARKAIGVEAPVEETLGVFVRRCVRQLVPVRVHVRRKRYLEGESEVHKSAKTHWVELEDVRVINALADVTTGVLFCTQSGRCFSSPQLRLARGIR